MLIRFIQFFLILILSVHISKVSAHPFPVDTSYILRYEKISLRQITSYQSLTMSFRSKSLGDKQLSFSPDQKMSVGLGIAYEGYNLAGQIGILNNISPADNLTRNIDLRANLYSRPIGFDVYFIRYAGFTNDLSTSDVNASNAKPNLKMTDLGINIFYVYSKKFSLKAAFNDTERQLKNAGSFLLLLSPGYTSIANPEKLFPDIYLPYFGQNANLQKLRLFTLTLAPGYGFTLVHKKFYITANSYVGAGFQYQECFYPTTKDYNMTNAFKIYLHWALGYNGDKYFAGLWFRDDAIFSNLEDLTMIMNPWTLRFNIGVRLFPSKKINKIIEKYDKDRP